LVVELGAHLIEELIQADLGRDPTVSVVHLAQQSTLRDGRLVEGPGPGEFEGAR
jgi:hypothetical protein